MANLFEAKQINKLMQAGIRVAGFAFPAAATSAVTTELTTAASTAGNGGASVPVQVSTSTTEGFITSSTGRANVVTVVDSSSQVPLQDASGNEVYGRLTEAAGVYTLSLFSLVAGVQTAHTPAATTVDFEATYQYKFVNLPVDAIVGAATKYVGDDPTRAATNLRQHALTPTALNTLPALSNTYNSTNGVFQLNVNGQIMVPAEFGSVSGTTVTWTAATAGYDLATTDKVYVLYTV